MDGTNSQVKHLIMERRTVPMFGGIQMERGGGNFQKGARWFMDFLQRARRQNKFISYDIELGLWADR